MSQGPNLGTECNALKDVKRRLKCADRVTPLEWPGHVTGDPGLVITQDGEMEFMWPFFVKASSTFFLVNLHISITITYFFRIFTQLKLWYLSDHRAGKNTQKNWFAVLLFSWAIVWCKKNKKSGSCANPYGPGLGAAYGPYGPCGPCGNGAFSVWEPSGK